MLMRRVWIIVAGLLLLVCGMVYLQRPRPRLWIPPASSMPVVNTRGSFDGNGGLVPACNYNDYRLLGKLPGFAYSTDPAPADLLLIIHGFNNSPEKALVKFAIAEEGLRASGYLGALAGYSWDSDRQRDPFAATGYHAGRRVAEGNAPMLAQFLTDYQLACPQTRLHLIGYSMGARLALETLLELKRHPPKGQPGLKLSSVHLVGAAVDNDEVQLDGPYGAAIEARSGRCYNYYSPEDNKLGFYYWPKEADRALGEGGIEHASQAPSSYRDVDVTAELRSYTKGGTLREAEEGDNHSGYLGNRGPDGRLLDDGVMDLVAQNIAAAAAFGAL